MSVQRSQFALDAGVNRPGDPADTIVPSDFRKLPKGADLMGCQVVIDADTFGGEITVRLQVKNDPDPGADVNELLQATSGTITAVPAVVVFGGANQVVPIVHALEVRANLQITSGSESDFDNLTVSANCVTDYITG